MILLFHRGFLLLFIKSPLNILIHHNTDVKTSMAKKNIACSITINDVFVSLNPCSS